MLKNKKWLLINQNEIRDSTSPPKYLIFIAEYILSICQQRFIEILLGRKEYPKAAVFPTLVANKVAVFATFCLFKNVKSLFSLNLWCRKPWQNLSYYQKLLLIVNSATAKMLTTGSCSFCSFLMGNLKNSCLSTIYLQILLVDRGY